MPTIKLVFIALITLSIGSYVYPLCNILIWPTLYWFAVTFLLEFIKTLTKNNGGN